MNNITIYHADDKIKEYRALSNLLSKVAKLHELGFDKNLLQAIIMSSAGITPVQTSWDWAVNQMLDGKIIRRSAWDTPKKLRIEKGKLKSSNSRFKNDQLWLPETFMAEYHQSNDWMVFEWDQV